MLTFDMLCPFSAWIKVEQLKPYHPHKEEMIKINKGKRFQQAVDAVEEYLKKGKGKDQVCMFTNLVLFPLWLFRDLIASGQLGHFVAGIKLHLKWVITLSCLTVHVQNEFALCGLWAIEKQPKRRACAISKSLVALLARTLRILVASKLF